MPHLSLRRSLPAILLVLLASPAALFAEVAPAPAKSVTSTTPPAPIRLTNYAPGETIRHPVALIVGQLADPALTSITLKNATSTRPTATIEGQAHRGHFKVLAELVPGENKLTLTAGKDRLAFTLSYQPQTNPYFVRMIYMTDSTGETAYQSQLPDDPQNFDAKLDTAMKLMQTMTAERMHDLGYGRRTFNLELDARGKVKVHVHKGAKPAAEYYKIDDQAWYREVAREMESTYDMKTAKNIVIAAYTRFDPETKKARGHTALGGGNQGLFGSGNLFTWPSSINDAQPAFLNNTPMDNTKVQDDSAGRSTFWGAASTTIGATLHEMGHAFGLPHTQITTDIMTRGFDQFNRVFTVTEPIPPHRARRTRNPGNDKAAGEKPGAEKPPTQMITFKPTEAAEFAPISAQSLLTSRWFALDDRKYNEKNDISIRLDPADGTLIITSPTGIRYIAADTKGDAVFHQSPPHDKPAPTEVRIPLADIRKAIPQGPISFRAISADGHTARASLDRLEKRAEPKTK